jgi:hypothetical protein
MTAGQYLRIYPHEILCSSIVHPMELEMKKLIGALTRSVTSNQIAMAQPMGRSTQLHCTDQKGITFICAIGKKHVSECNSGGNLQYHFGTIGAAKPVFLRFPATTSPQP